MRFPSRKTVERKLEAAKAVFLAKDRHLLEVDASERSMTHKFAEALQRLFHKWHVDCEYNRVGHDALRSKSLPSFARDYAERTGRVSPDIIIHRRGEDQNAVVIEAKPSDSDEEAKRVDIEKLRAFKTELGYKHAVQLTFYTGDAAPNVTWDFIV